MKDKIKLVGKKTNRSLRGNITLLMFVLLVAAFMLLPIVYIFANAFKPLDELFLFPPRFLVRKPTWNNFLFLFQLTQNTSISVWRYLFNSLFVAFTGTFSVILISSLAAYPLAKHKFKGKSVFLSLVVIAMLFRAEVLAIPQYIIVANMGIIDTYFAMIFPMLGGTLGVFMICQYISTMPDAILEAAKIDGAGEYRIFLKIVIPHIKPAWLTLTIFTFQGYWNTSGAGANYVFSDSLRLLPTILEQITAGGLSRAGVGAATALLMLLPPIAVYLVCQGSIMETMSHSGIK